MDKFHFDIHASVAKQLGQNLVTDDISILLEIIKNCYDADSDYAIVKISSDKLFNEKMFFKGARGSIIIEDNGDGMDKTEIQSGWLTISNSHKKTLKARGGKTNRKRVPLGDKGLGRLATQRLGRYVELFSSKEGENIEYHIGIDWRDFDDQESLYNVPIKFEERTISKSKKGTTLIISGLINPKNWLGAGVDNLARKLSQLVFPFPEGQTFMVNVDIDGMTLDLGTKSQKILDSSQSRHVFRYDEHHIYLTNQYKLSYFKKKGDLESHHRLISTDQGKSFFTYLDNKNRSFFSISDEKQWFVENEIILNINALGGIEKDESGKVLSTGSFNGQIDAFNRDFLEDDQNAVFNDLSELKQFIDIHVGVKIFRDGFGIKPFGVDGQDWLKLGAGQTSGASFYGLRPQNIIGYIILSAENNKSIEEKTDREGFIDSAYTRNFYVIMDQIVNRINSSNSILRRTYNEFRTIQAHEDLNLASTQEIYSNLKKTSDDASALQAPVNNAIAQVESASKKIRDLSNKLSSSSDKRVRQVGVIAFDSIQQALKDTSEVIKPIKEHLAQTSKLSETVAILERELLDANRRIMDISELAALGLTTEALSHEMSNVLDGISRRTKSTIEYMKQIKLADPQFRSYVEHIRSSVGALRKQISHLSPSLRYVREHVESFIVKSFVVEWSGFFADRLSRAGISLKVFGAPEHNFLVSMNKGRLTQILDNLLLNSEYWLKEEISKGNNCALIKVEIQKPFIRFFDDGRGVDSTIENRVFEPFITNKPRGMGRGLGLFIIQQLLDSNGCTVVLLPERNSYGNRYKFEVDLSGVINHE